MRYLFYQIIVKFVVFIILGLNVRHRQKLPTKGPAIIVANHNSHLDTMVLISLLPSRLLPIIKPVAAMDYFLSNPILAWFAIKIVGILPIQRKRDNPDDNPLQPCFGALQSGNVLIFFPEGSRGEPEQLSEFKKGIAKLATKFPDVPVIPVLLHGLGKSLPKGEALLVPFFCDVFVGDSIYGTSNRAEFMTKLEQAMQQLEAEGHFSEWE